MREYTKYSRELLEPLVRESVSVSEVLRKLGKRQTGSISTHLARTLKRLGIDTSHFLGRAANAGRRHKGGPAKKSWQERLTLSTTGRRQKAYVLRRALIESGRQYQCEVCSLTEWRGESLVLEVDHKDGNWSDNRPENLRFVCPNCHSQTPNYCRT
jgi:hypothetical protein